MKWLPITLLVLAALAISAAAEPSPIRIRVEQVNNTDNGKFSKTQRRQLKVHITNGAAEDKPALRVKFWIFGKAERGNDLVVIERGEEPAAVKSHATEVVETKTAKAHSVEEHYELKKASRTRDGRDRGVQLGKKIPASGERIVGHAVQVFDGATMVAEAYEPLGMRDEIGKAKTGKP